MGNGDPSVFTVRRVSREGLYEQVVQQLQDLIVAKHLKIGDRLPAERELCEQFRVSRPVIREAMKVLAHRGMLNIQSGRGTFVTVPTAENIALSIELYARARGLGFSSVVEVRRALESEIAALAATRAKREHVERLQMLIGDMDRSLRNPEAFLVADQEFHNTLAEATGNDLFVAITGVIVNLAQEMRRVTLEIPGSPERFQSEHRELLRLVLQGDAGAARKAVQDGLGLLDRDLAATEGSGGRKRSASTRQPGYSPESSAPALH
jgi:GntR family transcriptional regulator, transcriptional repressor for pyruvate dehydrogenase complex